MNQFKDFSIVSWNIRGAISQIGRRHSRELVNRLKPTLVILMETHCSFSQASSFWKSLGYEDCGIAEATGHAGGLWVLHACGSGFNVQLVKVQRQAVTIAVSKGMAQWTCTAVYARPTPVVRESLWQHLCLMRKKVSNPWLLLGDFNEILLPSEVKGGIYSISRAGKFANVMETCGLLDLGATGSLFTWYRMVYGSHVVSKRLDRAVVDCAWRNYFLEACVENLQCLQSNHRPIFLRCNGVTPEKTTRPFRFQACWLTHKYFPPIIHKAWENGNHVVQNSLQCVKKDATEFNSKVFGNIF